MSAAAVRGIEPHVRNLIESIEAAGGRLFYACLFRCLWQPPQSSSMTAPPKGGSKICAHALVFLLQKAELLWALRFPASLRAALLRARGGGGMNRATHGSKTKRCFVFRAASAARSRRRLLRTANAVRRALHKAQRFKPDMRNPYYCELRISNCELIFIASSPFAALPSKRNSVRFSTSSASIACL